MKLRSIQIALIILIFLSTQNMFAQGGNVMKANIHTSIDMKSADHFQWIDEKPDDLPLAQYIYQEVTEGRVNAFNPDGTPVPKENVKTYWERTDTILITDPITLDEKYEIVRTIVNTEQANVRFESEAIISKDLTTVEMKVQKVWVDTKSFSYKDGSLLGIYPLFYIEVNK